MVRVLGSQIRFPENLVKIRQSGAEEFSLDLISRSIRFNFLCGGVRCGGVLWGGANVGILKQSCWPLAFRFVNNFYLAKCMISERHLFCDAIPVVPSQ